MRNPILKIALDESSKQTTSINAINSGEHRSVAFVIGALYVSEELLQALEANYLEIELPLAYCSEEHNTWPAFPYTKLISRLSKRAKKNLLNIKRSSFSFSKYNASDFLELSKWTTSKELTLRYFIRQGEAKVNNAQQRKYSDTTFFRNLADFIALNKSLTDLQLDIYTFYSEFNGNIEQYSERATGLGLAHYFPYSDHTSEHPPKSSIILDDKTLTRLLKALVNNYSLVNINIDEWMSGIFNHISRDVLLDMQTGMLYNFLQKSLQEIKLKIGNITSIEGFLHAIRRRNQFAAEQMFEAAKKGETKIVEQLLNKGVSVHAADRFGNTALHFAAKNGFANIVKLLRDRQADWRMPNNDGHTPIHLAQQEDRWQIVAILLNRKYEVKPIIATPVKAPVTPKMAVLDTSHNLTNETSLYPKIMPVNSGYVPNVPKGAASTKKSCPFSNVMKFFKPAEASTKTSFGSSVVKNNTNNVKVSEMPMPSTTLMPPQDPKQIAREIADMAITGAINGIDANPSYYPANNPYGVYGIIEGIFNEATFDVNSRKKLINFIQGVLIASRLSLSALNAIQKECLIRHLALSIKDGILVFKDSSDCDMELTINRKMKDKDKKELINKAVHNAINDADERLRISSVPSAPPLTAEDLEKPVNRQLAPLPASVPIYNQNYMTPTASMY